MQRVPLPQLLNKLVQAQHDEDPSYLLLLSVYPELAEQDWINRQCTPDEWRKLVVSFSSTQIEWLIKCLVIAERDFRWSGGSVAAAIWLFLIYRERADRDWTQLADWILRNRGNTYLPFGSNTAARSLEEWHREQKMRALAAAKHSALMLEQAARKAERNKAAKERQIVRPAEDSNRKKEIFSILSRLRELPVDERLAFIAYQDDLPFEAISADIIQPCLAKAHLLAPDVREHLLKRMDRRNTGVWKALRKNLEL